ACANAEYPSGVFSGPTPYTIPYTLTCVVKTGNLMAPARFGEAQLMASAVIFMQWENYSGSTGNRSLFGQEPLTFNSRQERLHSLVPGDRLWLASRCPDDQQYYFVAVLQVIRHKRNLPNSNEGKLYGEFAIIADPAQSHDLGTRFPAEGLLRAFE